jgi:hypothetical protein
MIWATVDGFSRPVNAGRGLEVSGMTKMTDEQTTAARAVLDAPLDAPPTPDEVVRATMQWHFGEETGSTYWLRRAESLPFDPLTDVNSVADLKQFPDVSGEWRDVPVEDLVPQGLRDALPNAPIRVFETGGTTGVPKRIVSLLDPPRSTEWIIHGLNQYGFDEFGGENWLALGPTGPHPAGFYIPHAAHHYGGICFLVDLDPRWVKMRILAGRMDEVNDYVQHLLDQAEWLFQSQEIAVLATTPPLIEAIATRPNLLELVRKRVRGIFWGGASISAESRRLLETELFPGVKIFGFYGNTLMGASVQRPPQPGEAYDCVFQPFYPYAHIELVNPETGEQVEYGERGQVRFHRLDAEVFLPSTMERDTAIRVPPAGGFLGDGVAEVKPLTTFDGAQVAEGVY